MEGGDPKENCHEKLDLDAPLISTRRLSAVSRADKEGHSNVELVDRGDASKRVPFLWERVPGKPKEVYEGCLIDEPPPPPKLPPNRWHPSIEDDNNDDDDDDDDDDVFSDAADVFSLSESLGLACSLTGWDGQDSEAAESLGNQSPSFIINRFLPAAAALASSSASPVSDKVFHHRRHRNPKKEITNSLVPIECGRPGTPPKGCGLELFSAARCMKHPLCGFKRPMRSFSSNVKFKRHAGDTPTPSISLPYKTNDDEYDGGGCMLVSKARFSSGWGVPFLGYGLEKRENGVVSLDGEREKCRGKGLRRDGQSRSKKLDSGVMMPEFSEDMWRLPSLRPPSESWLSYAMTSLHRRC